MRKQKHFFCFQFPKLQSPPLDEYKKYIGKLISTIAVSPEQAANNAIYRTFHKVVGDRFKIITEYLYGIYPAISNFALDIDKADTPIIQPGLFGGKISSHKQRNESRLTKLIAERFSLTTDENSPARNIAREYIRYRQRNPL